MYSKELKELNFTSQSDQIIRTNIHYKYWKNTPVDSVWDVKMCIGSTLTRWDPGRSFWKERIRAGIQYLSFCSKNFQQIFQDTTSHITFPKRFHMFGIEEA